MPSYQGRNVRSKLHALIQYCISNQLIARSNGALWPLAVTRFAGPAHAADRFSSGCGPLFDIGRSPIARSPQSEPSSRVPPPCRQISISQRQNVPIVGDRGVNDCWAPKVFKSVKSERVCLFTSPPWGKCERSTRDETLPFYIIFTRQHLLVGVICLAVLNKYSTHAR